MRRERLQGFALSLALWLCVGAVVWFAAVHLPAPGAEHYPPRWSESFRVWVGGER